MSRRHRRQKRGKAPHGSTTGGRVRVKGHVRSPRGENRGKKPVFVKGYSRRHARA